MKRKYQPRETIKSLSRRVQAAIKATLGSDRFEEYLVTMARFHQYSFHNQMLNLIQKPEERTRVTSERQVYCL